MPGVISELLCPLHTPLKPEGEPHVRDLEAFRRNVLLRFQLHSSLGKLEGEVPDVPIPRPVFNSFFTEKCRGEGRKIHVATAPLTV